MIDTPAECDDVKKWTNSASYITHIRMREYRYWTTVFIYLGFIYLPEHKKKQHKMRLALSILFCTLTIGKATCFNVLV